MKGDGGMIFHRRAAIVTMVAALLLFCGCSTQPVSRRSELEMVAAGAIAGAAGGALFHAANTKYSMAQSVAIGAAGVAGAILLYEEIKRQAADYGPYRSTSGSEGQRQPAIGSENGASSGRTRGANGNASAGGLKLN
jgi:hypothetical protein